MSPPLLILRATDFSKIRGCGGRIDVPSFEALHGMKPFCMFVCCCQTIHAVCMGCSPIIWFSFVSFCSAPTALVGGLCICLVPDPLRTHRSHHVLFVQVEPISDHFVQGFDRLHVIVACQSQSHSPHTRACPILLSRLRVPPVITTQI
jgi:hypothetical protein